MQKTNTWSYKRHIHNTDNKYWAITMRERRNNTLDYFKLWNKWLIDSRDIEENKLFNASDYFYVKSNDHRIAR